MSCVVSNRSLKLNIDGIVFRVVSTSLEFDRIHVKFMLITSGEYIRDESFEKLPVLLDSTFIRSDFFL